MAKRIYVGNISYSMTDEELSGVFEEYGTVASAAVIADRMTGRSKGFGFVEMEDESAADKAIAGVNGTEVQGRQLRVSEAKSRPRSRNSETTD